MAASTTPTACSTALPAIATITRPANAWEMPVDWIVGSSAWTNQSDTNPAATPEMISSVRLARVVSRGFSPP